jgi:predicted acetyltransferase
MPSPPPPLDLAFGDVCLSYADILPGQPEYGIVPSHHFRILGKDRTDFGYLNIRIGNTEHVRHFAGHIGYAIEQAHRGHGYAAQACLAVARFVRTLYPETILTTDPGNRASIRTLEKLGAVFIEELRVPPHDPAYLGGSRWKRRYLWRP